MIRHFLFLIIAAFAVVSSSSQADLGPKPSFAIFFDNTISPDDKFELLTCEKESCEDQVKFKEVGPQMFDCQSAHVRETHSCFVRAYGFPPFMKLRINTSGKMHESEPFAPGGNVEATFQNGRLVLKQSLVSRMIWKLWF